MAYNPPSFASMDNIDVEELRRMLELEFQRVAEALAETTSVELRPTGTEPQRPRAGMIVYADGTNWDPGAGEGIYIYTEAGQWAKLIPALDLDYQNNWDNYVLPQDGTPPVAEAGVGGGARPRSSTALILNAPLIIEDPNIAHAKTRQILSHRIEHEWRQGPYALGWPQYRLGNPKAYLRGGVMLLANGDTGEIGLGQCNYNETTGVQMGAGFIGTRGNAVGRIYEFFLEGDPPVDSARSCEVVWTYQAGLIVRVSHDVEGTEGVDAYAVKDSLIVNEPRTLVSRETCLVIGVHVSVSAPVYNPANFTTRRIMIATSASMPAGALQLYIDP